MKKKVEIVAAGSDVQTTLVNSMRFFIKFFVLGMFLFVTVVTVTGQNANVKLSGVVQDEKGEPIPGATVVVKGTQTGTITDAEGKFLVESTQPKGTLLISFIGLQSEEVMFNGNGKFNIVLKSTSINLDEVVAIGYGTVKKRDLTGAVSSVKSVDITRNPAPNPMEGLQGRVAGLDITRTSGQAGAGINMQLRGTRSFTASGNPMFIIDGLPGDYATLNQNDIESIEVLKDASSTAVYGSAGSNGVIIITTKKAKVGKLNIEFNAYYGYNGLSTVPEMRTAESYLETKRDAYKYIWDATGSKWTRTGAIWQSPADDETIFGTSRYQIYQEGQFVDWVDEFMREGAGIQNYSISVNGGNEKTKAYVSFNYSTERGQYIGDDYKVLSTNMKVEHTFGKVVSIGSTIQSSYTVRNKAQDKLENALTTDPLVRTHNADGTLNTNLGNNVYNLLLNYQPGVYENQDNNLKLFVNPYIEIKPAKGLSILSRVGTWLLYSNNYSFDGIGSVSYTYNNGNIAKAQITQNRSYGYKWENILTYNFKVNMDHDFTLTGVTSWSDGQNLNTAMYQSNIMYNNFKWYNYTNDVNTTASSSYSMSKTYGYVGRLNYAYRGKYLFSASMRNDGSSVLYEDKRWDNFPALSGAWRITDEKFMAGTKDWLDNLKLRLGWGVTGSAKIDPYSSVQNLVSTNMSLGSITQPIYRSSQFLTNPDLGWEKSNNTNIGLDATLFKNRIDLSMEYYITNTEGVIWTVTTPSIYGAFTPGTSYQTYVNLCETKNNGLEVTLNTRNIVKKNFEWTSSATFAINKEKIEKLTKGTANYITNAPYTLALGEPVNSFYNYQLEGVWQIGQEKDAAVFGVRPGDLKVFVPDMTQLGEGVYKKIATDGTETFYYTNLTEAQKYNPALTAATSKYTYSAKDYQILGHNTPDWTFGFQNDFKYKNFDLSVYTYMRWGQMISYNMMGWYQPNGFATNASPSRTIPNYFNYWTPENPSNDFPVMNYQATSSTMLGFSGLNFVDGSFFKISNITFGYTLPAKVTRKLSIDKFRLYTTVTNPLVVAKSPLLKQYDPEMNGSLSYPLTRQVVLGLNMSF